MLKLLRNMSTSPNTPAAVSTLHEHLTIFVIIRKDLTKSLSWPVGSVIGQACHAVSAVLWENSDDAAVKAYMADIPNMHKVTLQIKNESQLRMISEDMTEKQLKHHLWIEQPENIPTALATISCKRSEIQEMIKKCSLYP